MPLNKSNDEIKDAVKDHYAKAIRQKLTKEESDGCSSAPLINLDADNRPSAAKPETPADSAGRFVAISGYTKEDQADMPDEVTSFGCGNPVAFIDVTEGQVVLDLGSGSGLDLILAARKVGPTGKVIGLDMTDEMIEVCRANLKKAGIENGEVRVGQMEKMPIADGEVDWIISNCVINLSPEKEKVFDEAYRVLKPGGRMLVSDIVTIDLPDELRNDLDAWSGCVAGAVDEADYIALAEAAGFTDVEIVHKIVYDATTVGSLANDACGCGPECCPSDETIDMGTLDKYAGKVASIKLSAIKP